MPHQDNLAVVFGELFQRLKELLLKFPAHVGCSGGQFAVLQLGHQVQRRLIRELWRWHLLFTVDTATLRASVSAMHIDDAILGDLSQPQVKRHRGTVAEVVGETAARFQADVLDDVAGVHSFCDGSVHAELDQSSKRFPVALQERVYGGFFTGLGSSK